MTDLTIMQERPDQADVTALLQASDRYHAALYPAESNHLVDVASLEASNFRFLVARAGGARALGCGAVLLGADGDLRTAELKRMWVDASARGTGLGRRLLEALEAVVLNESAAVIRLETGIHQPEALGLYRAQGYVERGPFGAYVADPLSVFMEKVVTS